MIRYVATDMDGTLLGRGGVLTDYTLAVMRRVRDAGVGIILASGRATDSMLPCARAIGSEMPLISCNGALTVDFRTGETLRADLIPAADAREVAAMLEAEGRYVQGYDEAGFYCEALTARSRRYTDGLGLPGRAVGRLSSFITEDTPKMLAIADPEVIREMLPRYQRLLEGRLAITNSDPSYLEITRITATKGNAVRALCERLSIDPAEMVAFGDGYNDATMLQAAGTGVAVANARPELKQIAAHICLANTEDGVARYLAERIPEERT